MNASTVWIRWKATFCQQVNRLHAAYMYIYILWYDVSSSRDNWREEIRRAFSTNTLKHRIDKHRRMYIYEYKCICMCVNALSLNCWLAATNDLLLLLLPPLLWCRWFAYVHMCANVSVCVFVCFSFHSPNWYFIFSIHKMFSTMPFVSQSAIRSRHVWTCYCIRAIDQVEID